MDGYLKERRLQLGLTLKEVAAKVGVSEATVSRWEGGQIANMKRQYIAAYAAALQTTPGFIMTGKEEQETDTTRRADVSAHPAKQKSPGASYRAGGMQKAPFARPQNIRQGHRALNLSKCGVKPLPLGMGI